MMTQAVTSYATVLLELEIPPETTAAAEAVFGACPQLTEALCNPTISEKEKFSVIEKLFPKPLWTYLKVVCRNGQMDEMEEIFQEYHVLERQKQQRAHAVLEYVTPLTEAQLAAMEKMICAKTGKSEADLELRQNPALLGGFVLRIGDETYDRSIRQTMKELHKRMIRR